MIFIKNNLYIKYIVLFAFIFISGCQQNPIIVKSEIELNELQTRKFTAPYDIVFSATMAYLMSGDNIIKQADKDTGYILSQGPEFRTSSIVGLIFTPLWETPGKPSRIMITAYIERLSPSTVSLRMKFKHQCDGGCPSESYMKFNRPEFYKVVFEKIEKQIYLKQEKI
jgi:hypothetical protein